MTARKHDTKVTYQRGWQEWRAECVCGWVGSYLRKQNDAGVEALKHLEAAVTDDDIIAPSECVCVFSCADDPATSCSLSGQWHVHPDDGSGTFGPCSFHPDAPGDL